MKVVVPSFEFRVPSSGRTSCIIFCLLLLPTPALPQTPAQPQAPVQPQPPVPTEPPKANLVLEDQFERKQDIAQFQGQVLIILFGDRDGMPANKGLGEKLHVYYHPTAKGQLPADANKAPVTPLPGLPEGAIAPNVRVLPTACIGKVPDLVKNIVRGRVKNEAPDTMVLLDFEDKMKDQFGMKAGEPNLVVIDAKGRVRMKIAGELDQATYAKLLRAVDYLRTEAAGR